MYTVFTVHGSPGTQGVIFLGFYRSFYGWLGSFFSILFCFLSDLEEAAHADLAKKRFWAHFFFLFFFNGFRCDFSVALVSALAFLKYTN